MQPTVVKARAPGKVNVFLAVGALQDDGYHEIATAYEAVSLHETVEARLADDFSVRFTGPVDASALPTGAANLAVRAAMLLARHARVQDGVALTIDKRVPIAGGMGGGSADAAATLVACAELWGVRPARDELHRLAAQLGADVPFALQGGTAVGTGRGDELSPALAQGQLHWVLALGGEGLATPEVYAELDAHRLRHRADIMPAVTRPEVDARVLQALRLGDAHMLAEVLANDLQAPALQLRPELARTLEIGESNGALAGVISGSGPTCAFLCADLDAALETQIALSAAQIATERVTGPVPGARLVD